MRNVIILEGPDGALKTTVAKIMARKYNGYAYRHEGLPPKINMLKYYGTKLHQAIHGKRNVVFDRFHVGELVYGSVIRGKSQLSGDGLTFLNRLITSANVKVFLFLPSIVFCEGNWWERKDREYVPNVSLLRKVYAGFVEQAASGNHPTLEIVDPLRLRDEVEIVAGALMDQALNDHHVLPKGVIGSQTPRYLIIGDEPSRNQPLDLPFFSTNNKSSAYLQRTLEKLGLHESDVAFVNAFHRDRTGRRIVRDLKRTLDGFSGGPEIIALGHNADNYCCRQDIVHETVPHPQYWNRFQHHHMDKYINKFRTAIQHINRRRKWKVR